MHKHSRTNFSFLRPVTDCPFATHVTKNSGDISGGRFDVFADLLGGRRPMLDKATDDTLS